jgi:SnoaL-like polyketide cyclase
MDFACVPDISFEAMATMSEAGSVVTEVRITGTNTGPTVLGDFGKALLGKDVESVPASGRPIDLPAVFVHEVRDDLVVAERQYWGLLEFLVPKQPRLLPQTGGFEGFGPMFVLIYAQNLAVAQRVDLVEAGVDFDPARSTTALESNRQEHSVSAPDHLLDGCLGALPGFVPAFVVRQHGVVAVHDTVLQGDHDYVGVVEPFDAVVVATGVGIPGLAHDLHVLL